MKCPYDHKIVRGRLIVDGEDLGDADTALDEGAKLVELVQLWSEIAAS
ncbi:hypothetical protein H6770_00820 [Candidatus Peribacteria bacterium]|nr:hypothetical protein [Candidatus Peribacteria bacterium]